MARNIYDSISLRKPKSNKFDLSHERKMSLKFNNLYPILSQEIIPGDSFKVRSEVFLRMAPMLTPVMHRVNCFVHYFFVPNRLVWDEWEDFITGGEDGQKSPIFPTINMQDNYKNNFLKGTLIDYLGIKPMEANATYTHVTTINALPFRAYQLIYNEYFRDQNLEDKVLFTKTSGTVSGNETVEISQLRTRAWEKDYFTSALPWSQRGGEAQIPLGQVEPVYSEKSIVVNSDIGITASGNLSYESDGSVITDAGGTNQIQNLEKMNVDATTINDLRKANQLQVWLEKSVRGGSRYIEVIRSFFGIKSSDARLQRPEYLGGGKQPIVISEVLNTTGTTSAPQGDMTGHGISMSTQNKFSRKFEEHGYVIGLMSIIPRTAYQDGIDRKWTKFDKFDYYWPEFANLGEQEIKPEEIYSNFNDATARTRVWGYQQRYAEYKYAQSSVHGDFRDTLDNWHLGRRFTAEPPLNPSFIHADARTNIFAVTEGAQATDYIWCQVYNKVSAIRPMPYFSIPEL